MNLLLSSVPILCYIFPHSDPSKSKDKKNKNGPKEAKKPRKRVKRNNELWSFFQMEGKVLSADKSARGICNMCGVFIKRSDGSPTLMKTHLEKYHPKEYKKYLIMVTEANLEKVNNVSGNNVNKKCNTY